VTVVIIEAVFEVIIAAVVVVVAPFITAIIIATH
jgi:hypothetical protein